MVLDYYEKMVQFLSESAVLIALLVSIVEYLKIELEKVAWYKPFMTTVLAFLVAFILAIPESGFVAGMDIPMYLVSALGLGLVATGVYKVGSTLARKADRD